MSITRNNAESLGALTGVLFALALALASAGCAPAPIYISHQRPSNGGEGPAPVPGNTAKTRGLTLTAPLKNLTEARILSKFGSREGHGGPGSAYHQGIDIKAKHEEPVRAAAAGTVIFAGRQNGYGNLVIVEHGNGFTTYYAHLSSAGVRPRQRVKAGETIGLAGKTGNATTTHLHFELRRGDRPIDPMPYLMACLRPV